MVACKDRAGPNPIGSLKVVSLVLKFAILAQPWVIIISADPTLNKKSAIWTPNEVEEKSIFFIIRSCGLKDLASQN